MVKPGLPVKGRVPDTAALENARISWLLAPVLALRRHGIVKTTRSHPLRLPAPRISHRKLRPQG